MNQGIIKDRKFALFFRSRIIAVIINYRLFPALISPQPPGRYRLLADSFYNLLLMIFSKLTPFIRSDSLIN